MFIMPLNLIGSPFLELFLERARVALTHSALNDVPICVYDIQNAHLKEPSSENTIFCGQQFRLKNVGEHAIIVRTLYGAESVGANN